MNNELVNIKQEWMNGIKSIVTSYNFQETDFGYERITIAREPGQTISINGRVMQQPGKEIKITQVVCIQGDGWISNLDDTKKVDFTQVKFETYQGDNLVMEYEEAFYWDDLKHFTNLFNHVFNG